MSKKSPKMLDRTRGAASSRRGSALRYDVLEADDADRTRDALRRQRSYDARPCLRRPMMLDVAINAIMFGHSRDALQSLTAPEMPYEVPHSRDAHPESLATGYQKFSLSLRNPLRPFDLFGLIAPL